MVPFTLVMKSGLDDPESGFRSATIEVEAASKGGSLRHSSSPFVPSSPLK